MNILENRKHYSDIAKSKKSYRSCIMVEELPYLDKFRQLGLEEVRKNKDGVQIVNIPVDKIDNFVNLSLELMAPGRWNEYVGPTTGFYFRLPSGEMRHLLLDSNNFEKIRKTFKVYLPNWELDSEIDLWSWLSSIDIYSDWLK